MSVADPKMIKVALAGNPNVGKSVIFNNLTGAHQHVGNWPGKTIDKKEGFHRFDDRTLYIVDLPGTYSLTAMSVEEVIARDYIIYERPDVVVNVVDAMNLERNLYLTLQLKELGANVVIALNKMDLIKKARMRIDVRKLEEELGVPVVPTIAPKRRGMRELVAEVVRSAEKHRSSRSSEEPLSYGEAEKFIKELQEIASSIEGVRKLFNTRWVVIKILEGDSDVMRKLSEVEGGEELVRAGEEIRKRMSGELGDPEVVIADARYARIRKVISKAVGVLKRLPASDLLDKVLLDRIFGIPIFLVILWWWFQMAFIGSTPFCDLLGDGFAMLGEALSGLTGNTVMDYFLFGEYGLIQGLGAVLSFVPLIMFLYFILSLLEDSGYMARVAFVMDRIMRKVGLSGRAIVPMIMGFGCNVPAVYATRVIPDEKDRLIAILTNPLMLCGARLVFFSAIAAAFFGIYAGDVLLSLYLLGIFLAFMVALALRRTVFREAVSPFILEFPAYQKPSFRVAFVRMWDRGSMYLRKALGVILIGLLIIGALTVTDASTFTFTTDPENSLIASLGRSLQPIFSPLHWSWRLVVAMVFGFVAKEIVLGASAMLYGVGEEEIASRMAEMYSPVDMYGYMTFILIYMPCIVTVAAIRQETGSWKWTSFSVVYGLILAYLVNLVVVTLGHLILGW